LGLERREIQKFPRFEISSDEPRVVPLKLGAYRRREVISLAIAGVIHCHDVLSLRSASDVNGILTGEQGPRIKSLEE